MSLPSYMSTLGSLKPSRTVVTSVPAADWAESDSDSPSFVANKPTAMRSPAALSFGQKTYDGSAAATVTAADLGALTAHQDISGKADKSDTYTKAQVDVIVAAVKTGSRQIVVSLASVTDPQPLVIYMVAKSTSQTNNAYDEYIYITADNVGRWEKIGDTEIDLSGYAQTANLAPVATSGSYDDLFGKPTIPAAVTVDSSLSTASTNPVQNKVVTFALNGKATSAQGAKADAALSRAEAVAGFTDWVCDPAMIGDERVYIEWDGYYWTPTNGGSKTGLVNGNAASTILAWEANDWWGGVPLTATRTRLPTMADIAAKANSSDVTAALALKADASSLPYALVNVTVENVPYVLGECFPIVYTISGQTTTITDADADGLSISLGNNAYTLYHNGFSLLIMDDGGVYVEPDNPSIESLTFNGVAPTANVTPVLGFTPTAQLTDRAINAVSLTESATLAFPAQTAGKARDFVVRLTLTETDNAVPSVTFPADVAYETEGGEWPDLTEAGTYIVRLTEVPTASESETARFFLQCSSAVADATPPSAGGES